jgi:hypothetical protein
MFSLLSPQPPKPKLEKLPKAPKMPRRQALPGVQPLPSLQAQARGGATVVPNSEAGVLEVNSRLAPVVPAPLLNQA